MITSGGAKTEKPVTRQDSKARMLPNLQTQ